MTRHVIAAVGLNRRALGSRHLPNGRLLAPDCTLTGSRMHRVAHPKPPNRDKRPRFRPMLDCATVFGGWEESSGKSQIKHIHNALDRYDQVILKVQEVVYGNLSTLERTIAGRWGAWQSFGPPVGGLQANRIPRSR